MHKYRFAASVGEINAIMFAASISKVVGIATTKKLSQISQQDATWPDPAAGREIPLA
jgi:hypothetical protein